MQHDFILLDRSGSMSSLWPEALSSINSYVKDLAEKQVDTGVTLATFDGANGRLDFEIIRDRIIPSTWRAVSDLDAMPRNMTPLNDAVARIVDLAERGNYDRVAIIIMTDGEENHSQEVTVDGAKRLLDRCRAKNWQVIFLGANYDNAVQATSYGNAMHSTVSASAGTLRAHSHSLSSKRATYGTTGQSINFTDTEKADLNKVTDPTHAHTITTTTTTVKPIS